VAEDAEDPIAELERGAQLGFLGDPGADVRVQGHRATMRSPSRIALRSLAPPRRFPSSGAGR